MKTIQKMLMAGLAVFGVCLPEVGFGQETVTFPDPNLEAVIRSALAQPAGPLTRTNLATLDALAADHHNIVNLTGLEWATNLTFLSLSGNSIRSLAPLAGLNRLAELSVDGNGIDDLSPLSGLSALAVLHAGENQITNANVLAGLTNLVRLRLSANPLAGFDFVSGLTRLRALEVEDSLLNDLSPLTALTNLGSLAVGANPIADLKPLGDLPTLTNLSLRRLGMDNLDMLQSLRELQSLNVEGNNLRSIFPLAGMTNLTQLNLRYNRVNFFSWVLSGLTNLTALDFGGNDVTNISFLQNLPRLTFLNLSENSIRNLAPLAGLTNLDYLVLSENPITNYPALAGLSGLANLELRGNALSNLTFMSDLTGLRYADLAYNNIGDVSPLLGLTNLGSLILTGNPLDPLAGLSDLSQLTNLWSAGNLISNVTFLQGLSRLQTLILDDNRVADPSPLAGLTNLTRLGLSRNPLTNYAAVAGFTNLTSLWVSGNGISNLSFVQGLTRLRTLEFRNNRVVGFSALAGLTNLVDCVADYNRLTNIATLTNLAPHTQPSRLSRVKIVGNPLEVRINPGAADLAYLQAHGVKVTYLPTNQPPTLFIATNWFIAVNETSSLGFTITDDVTSLNPWLVTVASSDSALIPDANQSISITNSTGTLTVLPGTNQTGMAELTLMVMDEAGVRTIVTVQVFVMVPQPVSIPDAHLVSALRLTLNKPTGPLTTVDLLGLTELFAYDPDIVSLSGLEWATNLLTLSLRGDAITNLQVLQNFTRLTSLTLDYAVGADLSPLIGLTNLDNLFLRGGHFNNLDFLHNLPWLTTVNLDDNQIADLGPLAGLTNLVGLSLRQNRLSNIDALQNLPLLRETAVSFNLLDIDAGPASLDVIQFLESRGTIVNYLPQRTHPTITARPIWLLQSNATSTISFGVADDALFDHPIAVTASSLNASLIPNQNIFVGPTTNADWTLSATPASNQIGTAIITLTATNDVGLGTSVTMLVSVIFPLPLDDYSLGSGHLVWSTGGHVPWFAQSLISQDGVAGAQSGSIQNGQESWMETTLAGPGILSFWWKISSEENYDWLEFYLDDDEETDRISGEVDWRLETFHLPIGPHTARWRYFKEDADSLGLDTAWVDQVTYLPLSWLEVVGHPTNGQCPLRLHPAAGRTYQLQASTNLSTWFPLAVVPATNAPVPYLDATATSATRYYRLLELSPGLISLQNLKLNGYQCAMEVHSPPGLRFEIEASTNLLNWSGVGVVTNVLGAVEFHDVLTAGSPRRFYRALLLP